jgi:hypothetical protein
MVQSTQRIARGANSPLMESIMPQMESTKPFVLSLPKDLFRVSSTAHDFLQA